MNLNIQTFSKKFSKCEEKKTIKNLAKWTGFLKHKEKNKKLLELQEFFFLIQREKCKNK